MDIYIGGGIERSTIAIEASSVNSLIDSVLHTKAMESLFLKQKNARRKKDYVDFSTNRRLNVIE